MVDILSSQTIGYTVMARQNTEDRQTDSIAYKNQTPAQMLELMLTAQLDAARCVAACVSQIEQGAHLMAQTVRAGGRLFYCGAGSSGLMAMADSLELPGTFGIDAGQIQVLLAGGTDTLSRLTGAPDDDVESADAAVHKYEPGADDCLICVSASGSTAYTLRVQHLARDRKTPTISLASNPESPLLQAADVPILLQTPPEVVAGSTRLGAGTAQKIALNMMSTLMASLLGHVYDGHMVNVRVDSKKLHHRALGIVTDLCGCSAARASECLALANGEVKLAVLLASGCRDVDTAASCLEDSLGDLGGALALSQAKL